MQELQEAKRRKRPILPRMWYGVGGLPTSANSSRTAAECQLTVSWRAEPDQQSNPTCVERATSKRSGTVTQPRSNSKSPAHRK